MRRIFSTLVFILLILILFSACTPQKISREALRAASASECKKEYYELTYAAPPEFTDMGEREFDVLEMKISGTTPIFKDVGEVKGGKIYLPYGVELRYSDGYPEQYYDKKDGKVKITGRFACSVPDNFWQNIKNDKGETVCEGIIVFEKVPFSFYYNEDGEPYVKCLETRFNSYFKEDRSYVEFINFAINYEPVNYVTEEDLLSR